MKHINCNFILIQIELWEKRKMLFPIHGRIQISNIKRLRGEKIATMRNSISKETSITRLSASFDRIKQSFK